MTAPRNVTPRGDSLRAASPAAAGLERLRRLVVHHQPEGRQEALLRKRPHPGERLADARPLLLGLAPLLERAPDLLHEEADERPRHPAAVLRQLLLHGQSR